MVRLSTLTYYNTLTFPPESTIASISFFWEVSLCGADKGNTWHMEELDLPPLRNVMGQGVEFGLPICNFRIGSGGLAT